MREQDLQENHLLLAHRLWKIHLLDGGNAIDATCGRGGDLLILASHLLFSPKKLNRIFTYDIQKSALLSAYRRISDSLGNEIAKQIVWNQMCHSTLGEVEGSSSISLIVYNLGYLPKGDKKITSRCETTILSLARATQRLNIGGLITAMCYPGHFEGAKEADAILRFASKLRYSNWQVTIYRRRSMPAAPFLVCFEK